MKLDHHGSSGEALFKRKGVARLPLEKLPISQFKPHNILVTPGSPRPKEEGGRAESIRIDIFKLGPGPASRTTCDFVWWLRWSVVLLQLIISVVPWVLYDDWGVMFVTLGGNLLAAITCAMPQWIEEKWASRPLGTHHPSVCL